MLHSVCAARTHIGTARFGNHATAGSLEGHDEPFFVRVMEVDVKRETQIRKPKIQQRNARGSQSDYSMAGRKRCNYSCISICVLSELRGLGLLGEAGGREQLIFSVL